jgi:ABC-type xylose transport system substrate-binding protein
MKRVLVVALMLGVLAVPIFNVAAQAAEYKVGFCVMTLAFTWMTYSYQALIDEAAKYPEIELIVDNANGDVSRQVEIIENFIAQGVDAIITDPIDVNTLIPVMEDAEALSVGRSCSTSVAMTSSADALRWSTARQSSTASARSSTSKDNSELHRRSTERRGSTSNSCTTPGSTWSTSRAVSSAVKRAYVSWKTRLPPPAGTSTP